MMGACLCDLCHAARTACNSVQWDLNPLEATGYSHAALLALQSVDDK